MSRSAEQKNTGEEETLSKSSSLFRKMKCNELIRPGRLTAAWYPSFLVAVTAWVLVFVVDKSCTFVEIQSSSNDDAEAFGRGTQQGRFLPTDSCRAWGKYENLKLDRKMVTTRASAALSIVLGAGILAAFLSCLVRPLAPMAKKVSVLICILTAGFQAMTHLMVHSDLCKNVEFITSDGVLYDTCSKDTIAYRITFATMGLWILLALLLAIGPSLTKELPSKQSDAKEQMILNESLEDQTP